MKNAIKDKRTNMDFNKHKLFIKKTDDVLIHHLKIPDTICQNIKFINTSGVLVVTGDYGNWIFCREFHPSFNGSVSDEYWMEKLQIYSTQQGYDFDPEGTEKELDRMINGGCIEYGYQDNELEEMLTFYEECKNHLDMEHEYVTYASNYPSFEDYECVVFAKKIKPRLQIIFDAFEEICTRIGNNTTSGDIANLPSNLTYYRNLGNNTISGDIANLPI